MSAVGNDGIMIVDVDGSCTNVAFEATAVGVYQRGLTVLPVSSFVGSGSHGLLLQPPRVQ